MVKDEAVLVSVGDLVLVKRKREFVPAEVQGINPYGTEVLVKYVESMEQGTYHISDVYIRTPGFSSIQRRLQ